jgi:hypothetical protein
LPISQKIACPSCHEILVRKPAGRCPTCGAKVAAHVAAERDRETRIEKVVAVVATVLVVTVSFFTLGFGLIEGIFVYAVAGVFVFFLARKTFTS